MDRALQRDRRYADQLIQIVRRVMNAAADTGMCVNLALYRYLEAKARRMACWWQEFQPSEGTAWRLARFRSDCGIAPSVWRIRLGIIGRRVLL